jgi:archaellum component FlaF (FlaF/FlaG flagellin family)
MPRRPGGALCAVATAGVAFTMSSFTGVSAAMAGSQSSSHQTYGMSRAGYAADRSQVIASLAFAGPRAATIRVSVGSKGEQANSFSFSQPPTAVSADGRLVAFESSADNLVGGDTNQASDVFVHDRKTGKTKRVSVASDGTQGNGLSGSASISGDGRFAAFVSAASNLVPGDTNGVFDVFVHDQKTGITTRVSVASDGTQGNADSAFVGAPQLSSDGRFAAFESFASNLVPGDTNGTLDIFVHDRQTGITTRASVASDGAEGNDQSLSPSISADGRFVTFSSSASNLVPGDTNTCGSVVPGSCPDIFVRDIQAGTTTRVSMASDGTQSDNTSESPSISADGRFAAFASFATNLVPGDTNGAGDIFVRDTQAGTTTRVSVASDGTQANSDSRPASISGDGRFVAFASSASNLVPADSNSESDIFVHDLQTGTATRVSVASDGTQANSGSARPSISGDGRFVSFDSVASNLVPGDTNGIIDVFIH